MRDRLLCRALIVSVAGLASQLAKTRETCASSDVHEFVTQHCRLNGQTVGRRVKLIPMFHPLGVWTSYTANDNCDNTAHRTAHGGVRFEHMHNHKDFDFVHDPANGVEVWDLMSAQPGNCTKPMVNAYWDNYYLLQGYTRIQGSDATLTHNCFGYAFGMTDAWVNEPEVVLVKDYDPNAAKLRCKLLS